MPSIDQTNVGLVYVNQYSKYENLQTICESSIFLIKDTGVYVGQNSIANYVDTSNLLTVTDASSLFQPLDPSLNDKLFDVSTDVETLDKLLAIASNDLNYRINSLSYNLNSLSNKVINSSAYGITSTDISNWNSKTDNLGTITEIVMNNLSMGTEGSVDLGTIITEHQSLLGYVNAANYDSTTKKIYLKHDTSILTEIDATDFIKDGMVNDVSIHKGTGGNAQLDCLVVSFNTDAGIEDIEISIDRIFNPSNYYTKTEVDTSFYTKSDIDNKHYITGQTTKIWFEPDETGASYEEVTFYDSDDNVLSHVYVKSLIDSSLYNIELIHYVYYDIYRISNLDRQASTYVVTNVGGGLDDKISFRWRDRQKKWYKENNGSKFCYYITDDISIGRLYWDFPAVNKTMANSINADTSVNINPYIMWNFGTVDMAMTITFNSSREVPGTVPEYMLRFVAGNNCNIILPSNIIYANGITPTYVAGRTYEINIAYNCAVVGEFY